MMKEYIGRGSRMLLIPITVSVFVILIVLIGINMAVTMPLSDDGQVSRETYATPVSRGKNATSISILVVPYFDPPSPQWNIIYQQAELYPGIIEYVIINPCSGPCGDTLSTDWQNIIAQLRSRGIKSLGYIYTDSQSIANIDYYMKIPAVRTDGIFFDMEGVTENLDNFKQYADYVHSLEGIVYINPGFNYTHVIKYIATELADVANLFEFGVQKSHYIKPNCNIAPSRVSIILGDVSTASDMRKAVREGASKGIGIMYMYGESYDVLPSYFEEMIKTASITRVNDPPKDCAR